MGLRRLKVRMSYNVVGFGKSRGNILITVMHLGYQNHV